MRDFPSFTNLLLGLIGIESDRPPSAGTRLFEDLELDSLQAFELIICIESIAGVLVPPEEMPNIWTLGDAYDYYVVAATLAAS